MNREELIKLAHEAGIGRMTTHALIERGYLQRFAQLVAATEREECAKLAQATVCDMHIPTGIKIYGTKVAKAIRSKE